jgi:RHS repeat-associated protein
MTAISVCGYTYPNGVQTSNVYDALNRLTQISSSTGSTLSNFTYSLDPEGNRLSATELGGRLVNYAYDAAYRLASEAITGDPGGRNGTVGYTYDAVGNRLQMNSTLAAIPSAPFSYDANDRISTFVYDANGNTISSTGITNSFDFEDRLIGQGGVSIVYDGDGNRVAETVAGVTTKYLVDDRNPSGLPQVVDELVNGTVTRTYAYGLSRVSQNQFLGGSRVSSFYGYDGQGSVRFLTNLAGASTDTYQYDAFGNTLGTTGSTPNTFLFSGEQSDSALSLYYFRARYMNPVLGRFMTMDPLPGNIQDPGSLHRYLYARNNAVNRTDPTGLQDLAEYVDILEAIEAYAEIPEKIGKCEYKLLTAVSNALTDAFNGVDVPPNEGPKAAYEFVKCFYEALIPPPEDAAKTVIKEMLGELFEGIDKILYDVLVKLGEELGYF